jgi:multicomponent Na+:H+ antiporter subunit C
MSPFLLYALVSVALFAIGLYGFLFQPHLLRKVIAFNIMGGAVFLLLIAVAYRNAAPAPDPVPHAMVLTGIVVAVSATALAVALVRRIYMETGAALLEDGRDAE